MRVDPNPGEKDLAEVGGSLLRWSSPGENQIFEIKPAQVVIKKCDDLVQVGMTLKDDPAQKERKSSVRYF
jgi:hypothetical protein